jgi:hypothetical protein
MRLPGSSKTLIMLAGPSITLVDHEYVQHAFGVNPVKSETGSTLSRHKLLFTSL